MAIMTRGRAVRSRAAALAAAAMLAVAGIGAAPAAAASTSTLSAATTNTLAVAAQAFLTQRTSALLDPPAARVSPVPALAPSVRADSAVVAREVSVQSELSNRRQALRTAGEAYTSSTVVLEIDRSTLTSGVATVEATETTTLTYARIRGDEPPNTQFSVPHVFTFRQAQDGSWQLVGERNRDPGALVAVNEPAVAAPALASLPAGAAETRRPRVGGGPVKSPTAAAPVGQAAVAAAASYDYSAMAAYAEKYWKNYNSAYRSFSDTGGDCTNFISQSLRAGGWKDDSGLYTDYRNWWYNSLNQTRSWINVNYWASFALSSGRTTNLSNVYYLGIGDILQMDFTNNGGKDHSMITTYRSGGVPYLTYHTTNTYRRSVASLVSAYPNASYYAFRT